MTSADVVRSWLIRNGMEVGTAPENLVAMRLRQWRLAFDREVRVGRYRLDFANVDHKVAIEVDGPFHTQPTGAVRDAVRDGWLRAQGWITFRISAGESLERELLGVVETLRGDRWT